jgi:hypothetical protein
MKLLNATEYALLSRVMQMVDKALLLPNVSGLGKGTDWQNEVFHQLQLEIMIFNFVHKKITYALSALGFNATRNCRSRKIRFQT